MFTKSLKLRPHGGSLLIAVPADVVRHFDLRKGSKLQMSYEDRKLVINLDNDLADRIPGKAREAVAA